VNERPDPAEQLLEAGASALRTRLVAGAVVLAAVLVLGHLLALETHIEAWLSVARRAGTAGVVLHAVAYVGAALLGLPLSPLTVAGGAAYGPLAATALAVPAVTLASGAAFLVGRAIARDPQALARGSGRVARASRAIGRGGLSLVVLLRLAPVVPFSVLNFAFGASPTSLARFAIGSFVGTIPSQLCYAWLGAILARPDGPERTRAELLLVAAAVVVSLLASAAVVRLLRIRSRREP
jgi:uncharacterized membrane protein YdjX (TVP38/TMEM64 family)